MLQSKITSKGSVFPFQERRTDEQSGNSEWSKSPPKNSHWGDHFLWIFGDILKHFIAQKGWVESLFFLAVLYKANSWPVPHPVHWITQSHWASCTLWGCRAPGETLSSTWEKAGMVSREYPHLSHSLWSRFFKMASPEVRHGVPKLLLCPQLPSKLSDHSACFIFLSVIFSWCHRLPSLSVSPVALLGLFWCHRWMQGWPHRGWAGHRAPVFQPKSFPSLSGAGSWVPEQGRVWSWALSGQKEGFEGWGWSQPFFCQSELVCDDVEHLLLKTSSLLWPDLPDLPSEPEWN